MTPDGRNRLTSLFESALERDPAERAAFLAAECAGDPDLQREVQSMLDSHERAGSFLASPAFRFAGVDATPTFPAAQATLHAGSRLGRYEIVGFLGAGGMGEVYRARDPELEREVSIKILPQRGQVSAGERKRFQREAHAVGALNHPNVVAVYDSGVEGGVPYVVSELLEGQTLRASLGRGALPSGQAIDFALQIAAGLGAAHDKGIVHRDLKPENLFITHDGVVKLLDFGLAKRMSEAPAGLDGTGITGQGFVIGTAGYMAPEQIRSHPADARSDIFAFGAVLYEMLTGVRAFRAESAVETMNAVLTAEAPPPSATRPDVPAALDPVVARCLDKRPERRYASTREIAAALEEARFSEVTTGTSSRRAKRGESARSTLPKRRLVLALAVVALAALVTTASLMVRREPPSPGTSGRPALAIMPFDDHSRDASMAWLATGLPSMLVTSLAQTPGLDVIGTARLQATLKELGSDTSVRGGGPSEVARRAGAGTVLTGALYKVGEDIRIDVQVADVGTGRVVAAKREVGRDVFALVDKLTEHIRAALELQDRPAGRPVRDVTTASLAAYELYVRAMDAWHNRRWADTRILLEQAVRTDPGFAVAHAQLAIVLERLGESGNAQVYRRNVMERLDRLPERQRLLAEATQESNRNPPRAVELLERLIERYPDEEEAYDLMVHVYSFSRDPKYWQQTLALMQRWARATPGPGSGHFHNHYGYALMDHGLFAEAEREFRAYVRVSPDEANPYDSLAELFLMTGRPREAIEHYDQALRRNPLFGNSYFGLAYAHAMLGRYRDAVASISRLQELGARAGLSTAAIHLLSAFIHSRAGRFRDAADQIARAGRLARELRDAASEADTHLLDAVLAVERRQSARALEAVARLERVTPRIADGLMRVRRSVLAKMIAGNAAVVAGDVTTAGAYLAAERADVGGDTIQLSWRQALAGEIALSKGELAEAEAAFERAAYRMPPSFSVYPVLVTLANHPTYRDGIARVRASRGEFGEAIAIYRRLNQPDIASPWTAMLEPRYVLAVARLADRAGDRTTAAAEYARFLELWRDADEGLPELAEARRYVRPLRASSADARPPG